MAISYQGGVLVTAEVKGWSVDEMDSIKIWANVLASSPDGRTIAAGDNNGGVYLLTFDPLRIIRQFGTDQIVIEIAFASSSQVSGTIENALVKPTGLAVLLLTHVGEELWEDGEVSRSHYSMGTDRWMLHPTDTERLLLFKGDRVHIYKWAGLERETQASGVCLALPPGMTALSLANEWFCRFGIDVLVQAIQVGDSTGFIRLNASDIQSGVMTAIKLSATVKRLLANVRRILGIHKSSLYFLSTRGWICSIILDSLDSPDAAANYYTRHCFIPPLWRTGEEPMIRMLPGKQTVAIAYRDDLVLFHKFLHMEDKVDIIERKVIEE